MKLQLWKQRNREKQNLLGANRLERFFEGRRIGQPLRYGYLEMIPLFGTPLDRRMYAAPETALTLTNVRTYGEMHLKNNSRKLHTIVPMHLGYFQRGAQNHAMCTSWVLKPGEEHLFDDACCIQESQGGYIKNSEDRFIILPLQLRKKAFELRGEKNYSKLWKHISGFNRELGLKDRGHLDELKQAFQPELLQTVYHLECQQGQTGAIFLCNGKVLGIELAPDDRFWAELHRPLVMYCYAPLRLELEAKQVPKIPAMELETAGITDLESLKNEYEGLMQRRRDRAAEVLASIGVEQFEGKMHKEFRGQGLLNLETPSFTGQALMRRSSNHTAYLSMFRKEAILG